MPSKLLHLNRASHKKHGKAPHKPILLLSIIELMDRGLIAQNKIFISPELVATFQKLWLKLVPIGTWQARFYLPFYHLTGDKFWHLSTPEGAKITLTSSYSPKSLSALKDSIYFAYFDESVWQWLSKPKERHHLKLWILKEYFPKQDYSSHLLAQETYEYLKTLEVDFLNGSVASPPPKYLRVIEYEARSALFKNAVPKLYNYSCAISGMRLTATSNVQMIDACHIEPWSQSKNDSIQNGIALSPTLHRAFDRHLISIDEDYRVVVSSSFTEDLQSPFNLSQFKGKRILLPKDERWYPSRRFLAQHHAKLL